MRLTLLISFLMATIQVQSQGYPFYNNHYDLLDSIKMGSPYQISEGDTINRIDRYGRMQGVWRVRYWNGRQWEAHFVNDTAHGAFRLLTTYDKEIITGNFNRGDRDGLWVMNVPFSKSDSLFYRNRRHLDTIYNHLQSRLIAFSGMVREDQKNYLFDLPKSIHNYRLDSVCRKELDLIIDVLRLKPELTVTLSAYSGIDRANPVWSSTIQAESVLEKLKNYLISKGIDSLRIQTINNEDAHFDYLIEQNYVEWWWNNRVEVTFE
ncbi:MAG: hypothetical protein H6608_10260 [Flavobacteriales bacterium]|nr:hypothetical protein [Bacteroidota bacterium]MCB9241507.1 hypothetical protein [Flavobacteriales bacterium]